MKTPSEIYSEAHSAGMAAGHGCTPTPMVVGTPTTPLGNDIDYSKDTYYVADVCVVSLGLISNQPEVSSLLG